MVIQERYNPIPIAANSTVQIYGNNIGGFACTTSGTLTIVANEGDGKPTQTIINAIPVTAGTYLPLPFYIGKNGGTATTGGGAVGCLGV